MRLGRYEWNPGLLPTLLALAVLTLLLGLGFWQLDRAEQKRVLQASFERGEAAGSVELQAEMAGQISARYRQVWAQGHYDAAHQYLLDNKVHAGRVGYQVLTPLRLDNTDAVVLVNRGWVPQGATRADLPEIPAPGEAVIIQGKLDFPPDRVFALGEGEARHAGWPKVIQWVEVELLREQLDANLLPMLVLLDAQQPDGFVREWTPVREFGPERHTGYAVTWFSCAVVLVILFFWATLQRPDSNNKEQA